MTHEEHHAAKTLGIGKAIAVLTSGGDAQEDICVRSDGPPLWIPGPCYLSVLWGRLGFYS
uniref:Phosphofructokinase, muscle n=1 Tax=Aotus nancymaae TaxID=37293 RepID=A0A2K5DHS0_AOTNA